LYSADQLFQFDSSTILVNGRNSYGFVNPDNWTFHEITHNAPFAAFSPSATGWTFGSQWHKEYFLDFNPGIPECFDYLNVFPFSMQSVNTSDTEIQATITDMGEVMEVVIPLTDLPVTTAQGCYLGVTANEPENFTVFPNLTDGMVTITHAAGVKEIRVYNIIGKLVLTMEAGQDMQTSVDLGECAPGTYLIRVDGSSVQRLVKR
jgi:hypothetical protein